jgi:hypothetical protein
LVRTHAGHLDFTLTQNHGTDRVALKIERQTIGGQSVAAGGELQHFPLHHIGQTVDANFDNDIKPIVQQALTTKTDAWEYEGEFRLVSATPGLIAFERDWLLQVCFGLRTPRIERERLMAAVREYGYTSCKFAETFISENSIFDMDTREVA